MQDLTARIILLVFVFSGFYHCAFTETPSASQIERSQEILEKEKGLEKKLKKNERVFIEKVTVGGAVLLGKSQIKDIARSYQKQWLFAEELENIRDTIKSAYRKNGLESQPAKISFRIEKGHLWVDVKEYENEGNTR